MKKFNLYGSTMMCKEKGKLIQAGTFYAIESKDLEHALLEVEINGGWCIMKHEAFKVVYIEEVEDEQTNI